MSGLHAAFCNDVLVGAVAVRLERLPDGKAKLYFLTLGVLAAYRNYGVGASQFLCMSSQARAVWLSWRMLQARVRMACACRTCAVLIHCTVSAQYTGASACMQALRVLLDPCMLKA